MDVATSERPRILPEQLRSARNSLALSVEDVATTLGLDPQVLIAWEEGRNEPKVQDLWALSDFYGRPTDYFLIQTPPSPSKMSFRLKSRRSMAELSLNVKRTLAQFEELCRAASRLEELAGERRSIKVTKQLHQNDPVLLAEYERHRLGLDNRPIKKLRERFSQEGVWIFELPIPGNEFSGFSWWHDTYGPCVLVNAGEIAGRRAFTLAHEYAHLLHSEESSICDLQTDLPEERFADRFAASFLMPAADVQREYQVRRLSWPTSDIGEFRNLANRYGVSFEALVRRLGDPNIELLSPATVKALLERPGPKPFMRARGPRWRRRLGERYVSAAFEAYRKGHISIGKLAEYLDTDVRKVRDELTRLSESTSTGSNV
jgi:Zn-dependent peptidase ImmA (M78 family)/transcriptional regulator with XRE-family HTH domain